MSEQKLYDIDASPLGARESGSALRRGVLVREAVKSAWRSVEDGNRGEMNDWHSANAMGLDVIGENDEEEEEEGQEQQEERWFEDLLSSLGEEEARASDDLVQPAEWTESEVQGVDDELYDYEDMEAYTIPLPPSPTVAPKSPTVTHVATTPFPSFTSPVHSHHFAAPALAEARTTVDIVSVDDIDSSLDSDYATFDSFSSFNPAGSPAPFSVSSSSIDSVAISVPSLSDSATTDSTSDFTSSPSTPISPITPIDGAITASSTGLTSSFAFAGVPIPDLSELELECAESEDLFLPPPMHRSYSSTSACSTESLESLETCDSYDERCDCRTPPLNPVDVRYECEALEFSTSFEKRLQQGVDDVVESFQRWKRDVASGVKVNGSRAGGRVKSGYSVEVFMDEGGECDDEECGLISG
jgi:hypothetical protein